MFSGVYITMKTIMNAYVLSNHLNSSKKLEHFNDVVFIFWTVIAMCLISGPSSSMFSNYEFSTIIAIWFQIIEINWIMISHRPLGKYHIA